jgi:hypothetical protein
MNNIIEYLVKAVCDAAVHNLEVQVAPACILWSKCKLSNIIIA